MFSTKTFASFLVLTLTIALHQQQQQRHSVVLGLEVEGGEAVTEAPATSIITTTVASENVVAVTTMATTTASIATSDDEEKAMVTDSSNETIAIEEVEKKVVEENNEEEEEEEETSDDGPDPWADIEDDEGTVPGASGAANFDIVDTMRSIRDNNIDVPFNRTSANLNETFDKVIKAWEVIDTYYLPQRKTWEKLLGLVTGLDVDVSPECFSSYFQGVSAFRTYTMWAYRCKLLYGLFDDLIKKKQNKPPHSFGRARPLRREWLAAWAAVELRRVRRVPHARESAELGHRPGGEGHVLCAGGEGALPAARRQQHQSAGRPQPSLRPHRSTLHAQLSLA